MALTRSIFAISILVLSMMAITSACGYEYDPNPYVEKPEQAEIEGLHYTRLGIQGLISAIHAQKSPQLKVISNRWVRCYLHWLV